MYASCVLHKWTLSVQRPLYHGPSPIYSGVDQSRANTCYSLIAFISRPKVGQPRVRPWWVKSALTCVSRCINRPSDIHPHARGVCQDKGCIPRHGHVGLGRQCDRRGDVVDDDAVDLHTTRMYIHGCAFKGMREGMCKSEVAMIRNKLHYAWSPHFLVWSHWKNHIEQTETLNKCEQ